MLLTWEAPLFQMFKSVNCKRLRFFQRQHGKPKTIYHLFCFIQEKLSYRRMQHSIRVRQTMTGQSESCQGLSAVTAHPRLHSKGLIYAFVDPETNYCFRSFLLKCPQQTGRDSGLGSDNKWRIELLLFYNQIICSNIRVSAGNT